MSKVVIGVLFNIGPTPPVDVNESWHHDDERNGTRAVDFTVYVNMNSRWSQSVTIVDKHVQQEVRQVAGERELDTPELDAIGNQLADQLAYVLHGASMAFGRLFSRFNKQRWADLIVVTEDPDVMGDYTDFDLRVALTLNGNAPELGTLLFDWANMPRLKPVVFAPKALLGLGSDIDQIARAIEMAVTEAVLAEKFHPADCVPA